MGGDYGPAVTVPAAIQTQRRCVDVKLILVGDENLIRQQLTALAVNESDLLVVHHTTQKVEMDELPSLALRVKKDSSMRVAINLVKQGIAQACVSAGNTGALMAIARFVLKTLPGIDRPAICTMLPTVDPQKKVRILDLGANVDSTAAHLLQFAVMGSVLSSEVDNIANPSVALLNIGAEAIKGNEQVKQAAQLLAETNELNYIGYIEGDAVYQGVADVVVCDGFVGNVALKISEGVAKMIVHLLKQTFNQNWLTRLIALLVLPVLKKFGKQMDPGRYNGASFVGLQGIVIKSHGGANTAAFATAIHQAVLEINKDIPQRIRHQVSAILRITNSEHPLEDDSQAEGQEVI